MICPLSTWQGAYHFLKKSSGQDFTAEKPNQKWCTDFTYLFLKNHEVRYNCTILGLYDRSGIASIMDWNITSDLAIRTLKKALASQVSVKDGPIMHSDQGTQYTSKTFTEFCKTVNVAQRLSVWQCADGAILQHIEKWVYKLLRICNGISTLSDRRRIRICWLQSCATP